MALILASGSAIRHALLAAAGVDHRVAPSAVDETPIKLAHGGDDPALATALAAAKAQDVSARLSQDWVIGGDSLVSVDGRRFGKPRDRDEAAEHLRAFSGRAMTLTSAVVLANGGTVRWTHCDQARLHVRTLSETFIHNYLEAEWPAVGACVGVFRMEGLGAQLFDRVEGSHFTILGLPLLPLLGTLREHGLLEA
ncbi:Maf family protein [Sphingomonas mesophila]|uniref:Maf family protein n=1 Tax=Sphingomonas mesophila TaxID=2303576 RepID=UPI000E58F9D3|nr:Maf family nucleotide pyrophosphatase [Sphingomonas mesophila]